MLSQNRVIIGVPYKDYSRYFECCRKAGRRWYYRNHQEQLERAARYRESNRELVAKRQREFTKRKLAEDPAYRLKISCQGGWKGRCRRVKVFHAEPFLQLLGLPWVEFTRYVERRFKRGMSWDNFGEWTLDHTLRFVLGTSRNVKSVKCVAITRICGRCGLKRTAERTGRFQRLN